MKFAASALLLAPLTLSGPCKPPSCASRSSNAKMTLSDFSYRGSYVFTTPAHQNAHGYVNFNVTSSVTGEKTTCEATSSQLTDFFYGTMEYTCADGSTTWTFSKPSGQVAIGASWTCEDEGTEYSGAGDVVLALECEETFWQNSNWTMGQIYSDREIECSAPTTGIPLDVGE